MALYTNSYYLQSYRKDPALRQQGRNKLTIVATIKAQPKVAQVCKKPKP